jgi:subtilisin family serine protease
MLSLAVALLVAAVPASARADTVPAPNEVDFAGASQVLPPAAQLILENPFNKLFFGIDYEVRPDYVLVRTPNPAGVLGLLQPLVGNVLRFAERNAALEIQDTPNDPLIGQEGQLAPLGVQQAWGTTNGSGVTIAVVDSGVQLDHPDLAPNIGSRGSNLRARNGSDGSDDQGHGTEVAGAAAARGGNGVGLAGVAWAASIVPVKVTDATGVGTATDIADGIRYALANGAKIINISMAGDDPSQALKDAVDQAQAQNVLLVVAAGNQARNIDVQPAYPASLPEDNVIAVGATNSSGVLAPEFSNRGPLSVDIAAPGVDVLTSCTLGKSSACTPIGGAGYSQVSGTSIAAPLVAGMAALLYSVHPDWTPTQVRTALMTAAAACRPVVGTASGELCAPPEIRAAIAGAGGGSGGSGGGGGAGAGAGAGPGTGPASSASSCASTCAGPSG